MELHIEHLNGSSESSLSATLKYHGVQEKRLPDTPCHPEETAMARILFDESHGQLLKPLLSAKSGSSASPNGKESSETKDVADGQTESLHDFGGCQTFVDELTQLANNCDFQLEGYSSDEGPLTSEVLDPEKVKILILVASTKPLDEEEVEAIVDFIHQGGSLLLAYDYKSLYQNEQELYENHQVSNPINTLLEAFGLKIKRLLSYPPGEVSKFYPHYLSTEVNKLFIREPAYLEVLDSLPSTLFQPPQVVACLPETEKPFLVAVETDYGRVAVIADHIIFDDKYIDYGCNRQLALNIMRWLASQNALDCFDASIQPEVRRGKAAEFAITLHNPTPERLENIECLLESDSGAEITEPCKTLRSIPRYSKTKLSWSVLPKQFGNQSLKLTIDILQDSKQEALFFDSAAQFKYLPEADLDLVILNNEGDVSGEVLTKTPFNVKAVIRQKLDDFDVNSLNLRLESDAPGLIVESGDQAGEGNWRLSALESGNCAITLVSQATGQKVTRLLQARPSPEDQISAIDRETFQPLALQLPYYVAQIHPELCSKAIQKIPCHFNTPEEHVRLIYPKEVADQLLEALSAACREKHANYPLVDYLLSNISPAYSPVHGCCLPYSPDLASHLIKNHEQYKTRLAQNFLRLVEDDQVILEQNITALVLHEKYGHGYFFKKTKLGKQLAILYKHGMTRNANLKHLKSPYNRLIYEEYKDGIQALWDSAEIVNEGFATWIELTGLPLLSGAIGQAAYRRKDFLLNQDKGLPLLAKRSKYFKRFPSFCDSRYKEGYDYFYALQRNFGGSQGNRCAVLALRKATDIDLGITETNGQIQFGLSADQFDQALLHQRAHDARADMRLRLIHGILQENYEKLLGKQNGLQSKSDITTIELLVTKLIREKLGW